MRDGIQVGPGRGKPDKESELRVRNSDEVSVSGFHQGQQACRLHQQAGYKTASLPTAKCKIYLYSGRRPYKRFLKAFSRRCQKRRRGFALTKPAQSGPFDSMNVNMPPTLAEGLDAN